MCVCVCVRVCVCVCVCARACVRVCEREHVHPSGKVRTYISRCASLKGLLTCVVFVCTFVGIRMSIQVM